jgi:hypothetical protein
MVVAWFCSYGLVGYGSHRAVVVLFSFGRQKRGGIPRILAPFL